MKPETISDSEFDFVEKALPDEDDVEPKKAPATTPAPQTAKTGATKAKTQKSLTQTIKETAGEDDDESSSPLSGTWVEKLATTSFLPTTQPAAAKKTAVSIWKKWSAVPKTATAAQMPRYLTSRG